MISYINCKRCGASITYDDTQAFMFCGSCGTRFENTLPRNTQKQFQPAVGSYTPQQKQPNSNLIVTYNTTNPRLQMFFRNATTEEKLFFDPGQTRSFSLTPGTYTLFLRLGGKFYRKDVAVSDFFTTRIDADFNGRAHINVYQMQHN
ncbi:MAG: hypothetical protein IJL19_01280 [Clostridiales bacterium]|nr:hypothetical protein [Clostridiales bacterium]